LDTSFSSPPASAKNSSRKSFSAELLLSGFSSLSNAAWISLSGLIAGLWHV
jgi:hypothetical protein